MISLRIFIISFILFCCFKEHTSVIWPCDSNETCTTVNSICSAAGKCECNFGFVFSSNYEKCLATALYEEPCEDSTQCNLMPSGAICKLGKCECDDGYTYVRGKCRQLNGLGDSCNENTDCYFGYDRHSVACKSQKCSCADGYYLRHENICRQKAVAINDSCVVDADCDELENNAKCDNYKCVETTTSDTTTTAEPTTTDGYTTNSVDTTSRTFTETGVQTSLDYYNLKPISENTTDDFNERIEEFSKNSEIKTFSNISKSNDDEETKAKYGDTCNSNSQPCIGLSHSVCSDNMCYCQLGYYPKNGKCFAELGEIAENAESCEFDLDQRRFCSCVKNYFYESSLRACKKPITFNLSCTSNSQCSPYGAYCHPVIPRRCKCQDIAEMDEKRQMCVYKQGLGSPCEQNSTCNVPHAYCSPEKVCSCQPNYNEKDGVCATGIGAGCTENKDCQTDNTVCESADNTTNDTKSCQCRKGYVHFKDECLKEATELGDDCTENDQCKPLLGTCLNNKCDCKDTEHFRYGRCEEQKTIGDSCARAGECFMPSAEETVECRNSVCACQLGYKHDVEKHVCVPQKSRTNSSGRPSCLKIITFILIGSAFVITTAALKQAYF